MSWAFPYTHTHTHTHTTVEISTNNVYFFKSLYYQENFHIINLQLPFLIIFLIHSCNVDHLTITYTHSPIDLDRLPPTYTWKFPENFFSWLPKTICPWEVVMQFRPFITYASYPPIGYAYVPNCLLLRWWCVWGTHITIQLYL